jgi:hypothetical protein
MYTAYGEVSSPNYPELYFENLMFGLHLQQAPRLKKLPLSSKFFGCTHFEDSQLMQYTLADEHLKVRWAQGVHPNNQLALKNTTLTSPDTMHAVFQFTRQLVWSKSLSKE